MKLTDAPPEVQMRFARRDVARRWRLGHATHPDRERLWRAYRTGALRNIGQLPPLEQAAVRAGLTDAQRAVPWPALPDDGLAPP